MHQEATDELGGLHFHGLLFSIVGVILVGEFDLATVHADEPFVGDRHSMGIPGQVAEQLGRLAKRALREDDPFDWQRADPMMKRIGLAKVSQLAMELKFSLLVGLA